MTHDPVETLLHRTLSFPGPGKIRDLQKALTSLEDMLVHLKDQEEVRLRARLNREGQSAKPEDTFDWIDLAETVDVLYPKAIRGGFLISLWSVFEICIKDLVEHTRKERRLTFGLGKNGPDGFELKVASFFQQALQLEAFPDQALRERLKEIRIFRNALAHKYGDLRELPESLRSGSKEEYMEKGVIVHTDFRHKFAIPTREYAQQSLESLQAALESLCDRVYPLLHPEHVRPSGA